MLCTLFASIFIFFGSHHCDAFKVGANSTISNLSAKTSLAGGDLIPIVDNSVSPATTKQITVTNASSSFKTFNDITYSPIAGGTGIVTVGTIGTGSWNATAIPVSKGGTGTTTFASNYVLLGDGTNGFKTVNGQGTSGYFLTSNGAGVAPTWQATAVDQTANYNWTGTNLFKNLNASSTAANPIVLNGLSFNTPSSHGASSTVLMENGNGSLSFNYPSSRCFAVATSSDPFGYLNSSYNATYTHNLGGVPSVVRASWNSRDNQGTVSMSQGTGEATTTGTTGGVYTVEYVPSTMPGVVSSGNGTPFISMRGHFGTPNTEFVTASVVSWSATNVVIQWTAANVGYTADDTAYSALLEFCL